MESLRLGVKWLDDLLPTGLPLHSSTLISGPGGTGKPLIGNNFVAAWLRAGGSVVFMSLQYPSTDFLFESLKITNNLELNQYQQKVVFFFLDVTQDTMAEPERNIIKANLVKPEVWDAALAKAEKMLPQNGPGVLVFGSALNLLLFSPTYKNDLLKKVETLIQEDKLRTYVFSVSTSANKDEIEQLEEIVDNLIITRSEESPFRLYMRIERMKNVPFLSREIQVPIPSESLEYIKGIAEHSRKRVIPQIMKI